jgi:hypothetical protein
MPILPIKRRKTPLTRPTSITQLLKAVRKGHVTLPTADRLAALRHRRGARGHETPGLAK